MKTSFFLAVCLLFTGSSWAQSWSAYLISVNGDTINCVDQQGRKQGRWVMRVEPLRGEPGYEEEGSFADGQKEGAWRKYNLTGDLLAVENFRWGNRDGKQLYFTMMGDLIREESWKAVNPENPYDTIDVPDLNNPMVMISKVVKHEAAELRHGTWKTYDPQSGLIIKTETFLYGQREGSRPPADSATTQTQATPPSTPAAKPKAVEDWEKKQSGKKKVTVRDGRTGGG